jgi:hypothetical protein
MSLTQTTTGDIGSSSSPLRTPAPTETTPESDTDDSDVGSVSALHGGGGHTFELRKIRNSSEKGSRHGGFDQEEASSEDDSEKEDVRPVRRVGSRSKEYTHEEEQAIVRKFDRRLTLFIALLYMLSFLDRSS